MSQTTWDMVRSELEARVKLKHERGDQWRGSSPIRPGSDGNTFVVKVAPDGEHGTYYDHKEPSDKGSLYELAAFLNIAPVRQFHTVQSSKRGYNRRAEYAEAHGAPDEAYAAARWSEVKTVAGRPCIEFPTQGGLRFRFVDGQTPAFKSQLGYKQCWYGLAKAAEKAIATGIPLVFCNGEPSVVTAQWWGVPAATITSGEKGQYPPALIEQLKTAYSGRVIVALDCDYTGATAAFELVKQFQGAGIDAVAVDLGLGNGGDLADFCKLYQTEAPAKLTTCAALEARNLPPEQLVLPATEAAIDLSDLYCSDIDALQEYIDELTGEKLPKSPPLINPFTFLHSQGGLGHIIPAGKLIYFASVSGGTKTIGFETGWEAYQEMGIHSIVYSPEWVDGKSNAVEFAARSVQRTGGANFEHWQDHRLHLSEQAFNTRTSYGKPMSLNEVARNSNYAANLMRRPGRVFFIKKPGLSAEQLCSAVDAICQREARNGIVIQAIWLDFAQLLWLQSGSDEGRIWIETAINKLKDACRVHSLVGFVNSQMRKDDAEAAKTGGKLDASMMQFLSDQQANFVFAFTPKFEDGKRVTLHDANNPDAEIGVLRGRTLKNSLAPLTEQDIEIPVNFSRLAWMMQKGGSNVSR